MEWAGIQPHPFLPGKIADYLFAIPNGAHLKGPGEGKKLKALGMKPGVSDLFLSCPSAGRHGLYIEMKRPRETFDYPSQIKQAMKEKQKDFIGRMRRIGYAADFAFGWDEARCLIEDYLKHGG
jgi:hypothetical protein